MNKHKERAHEVTNPSEKSFAPKYLWKSMKGENGNLRYEIVEIHSEGEWIHVRAFPQIVLFLYEILGDNSPPFICAWPPIFP